MLSVRMSPSSTTSPRAFTNRHSITLSMRLSTSFRVPLSRMGVLPSTFAMRSSSLAFAEQMRAVRLSTCALHMASSCGLLGSNCSLFIVYLLLFFRGTRRRRRLFAHIRSKPAQSPPKDLCGSFARAGARKGLSTAHRKTSKSPSKVGAPSLVLFRGIRNPSRSIWAKKTREASAMANTSLVRGTDTCTRPAGACGLASVYTSTSRAVAVSSLLTGACISLA